MASTRHPKPMILEAHQTHTYGGNAAFNNFQNDYAHIRDSSLRRRLALSEIDKVPLGWYHARACLVAGAAFFVDSYNIYAINLITVTLGMIYWNDPPTPHSDVGGNHGILPMNINIALKIATSAGAVVGQLGFGWLADVVGRRRMYGVELSIIILSTLAQSMAAPSTAVSIAGVLIFWRIVMGIGIGGDYPLSAVIASEFAPTRWRGAMIAAVFSMQGLGQLAAALVSLITTVAFKSSFLYNTTTAYSSCHPECKLAGDRAWRIIVAVGALPACFAIYYRVTIPETPRYTFDVEQDIEKAHADIKAYVNKQGERSVNRIAQHEAKQRFTKNLATPKASWSDAVSYFSQRKNFKIIFGTMASWFFLDFAFYGLNLNNSIVINIIKYPNVNSIYANLVNNAIGNIILVCAGSIPGYWLTVATIDTIGRKPIQIGGFFLLTVIFLILGFAYRSLPQSTLLTLFIFSQFFFNFGPNATTFIIPGECFPTRYRSTGHGISAAIGKIGAIIAQVISQPMLAKGAAAAGRCREAHCLTWIEHLMKIFALCTFCGLFSSLLVPETKGRTLEELAGEAACPTAQDHMARRPLHGHGWQGWWARNNPFTGGKPAGFTEKISLWLELKPKLKELRFRYKRARVSTMTSPEFGSLESRIKRHPVSRDSNRHHNDENDDLYLAALASDRISLPDWGLRQGSERLPHIGQSGSVPLQDVGKLLR